MIPFEPLWAQYRRVAKRNAAIVLTASQPFTSALVMSNPGQFKYEWIWEKSKASNFLQARVQALKAHESVLVFCAESPSYTPQMTQGEPFTGRGRRGKKGAEWEGVGKVPNPMFANDNLGTRFPRSVQYFKTSESEGKVLHPTQKPVALMEYMIRTYCQEGETVLDNCAGSFTTGVACLNTGRNFIGIERDDHYFKLGSERMAKRAAEIEAAQSVCDTTGNNRSGCQAERKERRLGGT